MTRQELKNKTIRRHYCYFLLAGILLLSGCQSVELLSIDYMLPADISFPESLRKVAVVNNVPDNLPESSPAIQNGDTLQSVRRYQGNATITAESLAEALAGENYFDEVVICDSALNHNKSTQGENILSRESVNTLAKDLNVDFLISLEDIQMEATHKMHFLPEWDSFYGTVDVKVYPSVRVYLPNHKKPMVTVSPNDSIFWEAAGNSESAVHAHLISEKELIEQASEFAGTVPVRHLLPSWKTAQRYMFTGGSVDMRDAAIYAKEGDWTTAIELWQNQYTQKKGKKKMHAAYNIALGYEMQDSITIALEWAIKAFTIAQEIDNVSNETIRNSSIQDKPNYLLTALYVNELQERKNSINLLNMQMKRFNEE